MSSDDHPEHSIDDPSTQSQLDALNAIDDHKNGFHPYYFPSGDYYKGHWLDNKMHGEGTLILNIDKSITASTVLVSFQGQFEHGLPILGKSEYADGSLFDGELKDGLSHGYGVYTKSGLSITGQFAHGQPQGEVTVIFQDGDDMTSYNGSLIQTFLHGTNGVMRFPQSSPIASFHGDFDHNARVNWGLLTFRPPASTLKVEIDSTKMVLNSYEEYNQNRTFSYRLDGFNYVPGSNMCLSPHYQTHSLTSQQHTIKKIFGQFENDRLIFGTIYYADNSVYTGYLLSGTIGPNGIFTPNVPTTNPNDINPFAPRENHVTRYGFGIMYHYTGNYTGTITISDWSMDQPQGQSIVLYNYQQDKNPITQHWGQEIEYQQDYDDDIHGGQDLQHKLSSHIIFRRDIICKGETAVLEYLQQLITIPNTNTTTTTTTSTETTTITTNNDTTTTTTTTIVENNNNNNNTTKITNTTIPPFQCDAIYIGFMQRGQRHDFGLYLTLQRYSTQINKYSQDIYHSTINTPPILPNNEIDSYYGLFEADVPQNKGEMVFLPSQLPTLTSGLTTLDVAFEYLHHFRTIGNFDMVAFHQYKHNLYKNTSKNNNNTTTTATSSSTSTTLPIFNNDCSLTYYSGTFFNSCRSFGTSFFTSSSSHMTHQPDVIFYGSHHSPTNELLSRAKQRSYCQDMVTYLHSDLFRNYEEYTIYYQEKQLYSLATIGNNTNESLSPRNQTIYLNNDSNDENNNTNIDSNDTTTPTNDSESIVMPDSIFSTPQQKVVYNATKLPDKYQQPRRITAATATTVRGDSSFSSCLSLPNIGALFYFTPNTSPLATKTTNTTQSNDDNNDTTTTTQDDNNKTIPLNEQNGPYKSLSVWFGAVSTVLQRLGHGCMCLDIDMDLFVKNNILSLLNQPHQRTNIQQQGALSALRSGYGQNNGQYQLTHQQQQNLVWISRCNYNDPLCHPLLLWLLNDSTTHVTNFAQLQATMSLFSVSSQSTQNTLSTSSNSNNNNNTNAQHQQHQMIKLLTQDKVTSCSKIKVFAFFLYDLTFYGTIMTSQSTWQGPIVTIPLPNTCDLNHLCQTVTDNNNNNSTSTTTISDVTTSTPTPTTKLTKTNTTIIDATKRYSFIEVLQQLLKFITLLGEQHLTTIQTKSFTDLLGDIQKLRAADEKFTKFVTKSHHTPFITKSLHDIEEFLSYQLASLPIKNDQLSTISETLRYRLLLSTLQLYTTNNSLPPLCPQAAQFLPYGLGEMIYLTKLTSDGQRLPTSTHERYTGFALLSPLTFGANVHVGQNFISTNNNDDTDEHNTTTTTTDTTNKTLTLRHNNNAPILNRYLRSVKGLLTDLRQHQQITTFDPFQQEAYTNLLAISTQIETITQNSTFVSLQTNLHDSFSSLRLPSHHNNRQSVLKMSQQKVSNEPILSPQEVLEKQAEMFQSILNPIHIDNTNTTTNNNDNKICSIVSILLDGAISTPSSPNIFIGNLIDISPTITLLSNKLSHTITRSTIDIGSILPFSHGQGIITAGNLSQSKTLGTFHLGVILEGVEIDDSGDVFIGPYQTVIDENTGLKQQQRHGKYIVVLTLRKWVVICQYQNGNVINGQVYYNIQQHVLNEISLIKPKELENFNFNEFVTKLYENRHILARKLTTTQEYLPTSTEMLSHSLADSSLDDSISNNNVIHSTSNLDQLDENEYKYNNDDEKEGYEDIFALPYDPTITDITELHNYSLYYTTTNDDDDKALEPLYEDELVSILHSATIPPPLHADDESSTPSSSTTTITDTKSNEHKSNSDLFIRVTADGLVCFDNYSNLHSSQHDTNDDTNNINQHIPIKLSDQVRTTRSFRYRIPSPDVIGQLSRLFYDGGLDGGFLPHGHGTLIWSTPNTRRNLTPVQHFSISLAPETSPCEQYIGEFEHGVLHGHGKAIYHTPSDYSLVDYNATTHVSSSFLCPCIESYEGQFDIGMPIQGTIIFDPKSYQQGQTYMKYIGQINHSGELDGNGQLEYFNNHKFDGILKHSRPIEGTLIFNTGVKYIGHMHSYSFQDGLLDPFYIKMAQKINKHLQKQQQQNNTTNSSPSSITTAQQQQQAQLPFLVNQDKNEKTTLSIEQVAIGNSFTLSHFTLFTQLCQYLSTHYQHFAIEQQQHQQQQHEHPVEVDENGIELGQEPQHHDETYGHDEQQQQQQHSGYYDIQLPIELSLFSPLFTDVNAQFRAYQQQQQLQQQQQQDTNTDTTLIIQQETKSNSRPTSSSSSSSIAADDEQQQQQAPKYSIFDLRTRLQSLMRKLKEHNAKQLELTQSPNFKPLLPISSELIDEEDTNSDNDDEEKQSDNDDSDNEKVDGNDSIKDVTVPEQDDTNNNNESSTSLTKLRSNPAYTMDLVEKELETEIIQYVYDLKALTSELYPLPEPKATTTELIPLEQQLPSTSMYILYQGRLTVVSLKQIMRLFSSGTIIFPTPTSEQYDENSGTQTSFLFRCKEIVMKTLSICMENTNTTITELNSLSTDADAQCWPVLPLPSSIALQRQFEQQQQRIQKHTSSLTLAIHSNINIDQFITTKQKQLFAVSSTNYKSRLSDSISKSLSDIQSLIQRDYQDRQHGDGTQLDSLNNFLDESSDESDEEFDPTLDLDQIQAKRDAKKALKIEKLKQLAGTSTNNRPKSPLNNTPNSTNDIIDNNTDGGKNAPRLFVSTNSPPNNTKHLTPSSPTNQSKRNVTTISPTLLNKGGKNTSLGYVQPIESEYRTVCDSGEYVTSKINQLKSFKDQIHTKLTKLSKLLKMEESDYTACCQRFGKDQFEQQDAKIITGPIWSTHAATKMLFDKQIEDVTLIIDKDIKIRTKPQYSATLYTILDANVNIWELFLLRKEILVEDRLKVFFLLTKIALAFKHRRLLLVLLLHSLSKHDVMIDIINSKEKSLNAELLKTLLIGTKGIFQSIGTVNQMISDLKQRLRTTLNTLLNESVPKIQKVQKKFIDNVLQTAVVEFTSLRSKISVATSELESILITITQTLETTTKLLEQRHKQRKQLSQVLFVEELQTHIVKNDLLSSYALIYTTNYHPQAQMQLLSRQTKDHPLDLSCPSQQTYLTPIQLAASLGLSYMVVLLSKLGCSLQQNTLTAYSQLTPEQLKERDLSIKDKANISKDVLARYTLEKSIPEVLSNKTIVELIVQSKHYDMLGVLHFLGYNFDAAKATTVLSHVNKATGETISKHIVRPLLHHYVSQCDLIVVKYLLLLGLDPNINDINDDNINTLMLACKVFSIVAHQHAKSRSNQSSTTSSQSYTTSLLQQQQNVSNNRNGEDKFSSSNYEDTTSFGVILQNNQPSTEEETIDEKLQNAMEIVHVLVQYGAKVTCKDNSNNTILHHLFSQFYDQNTTTPNTQPLFPTSLKQLSTWLVGHGARYRELRNNKNQPAYLHQSLCTEFDNLRQAYISQAQQFHYNFTPLTQNDQRWQIDDECLSCTDCLVEFGLFTRKHHCRCCGYIYCDQCSKITINNNTIKTCCSCYNKMHMLTLPRDRKKEHQAAQLRQQKVGLQQQQQQNQQQLQQNQQLEQERLKASQTYNYATFLPSFILEFHTEIAQKHKNLVDKVFTQRGICWFVLMCAKQQMQGFQLTPNMSSNTINSIITKNDTLKLSLKELDNRASALNSINKPPPPNQLQHKPQQQQQKLSSPPPPSNKTLAPPPPVNKTTVPPPPANTKLGAPPPPNNTTTKLASPPPPSNKPGITIAPPSSQQQQQQSGIKPTPPTTPTANQQQKFTVKPHVGLISQFSTQLEEDTIQQLIQDLLEQTNSSITTNIQKDKVIHEHNGGDFVLVHVANKDKVKKARNPLEDDDDDNIDNNKSLERATKIQPSLLDDDDDDFGMKGTSDEFDMFG